MRESDEQEALMQWAAVQTGRRPELRLLHHIPNGGKRNAAEAAHFKRLGVKPGVPDLCLPVPRQGYHGLYIEMKCGRGKLSDCQREWIAALTKQGYCCAVCWSWEQAKEAIQAYLEEKHNGSGV